MRITKLQQEYEIELKYILFPLHPNVSDEGMTLEELFKGRDIDLEAAQQQMQKLAAAEGLEYGVRSKTYNSRLAQELSKWAESQPDGSGIHNRLYKAYFVENTNLASIDHLVTIAEELGLDGKQARSILENRTYKSHVDSDWNYCREVKVVAIPTYQCNDKKLVGAQTYEALSKLIESQGAPIRSQ